MLQLVNAENDLDQMRTTKLVCMRLRAALTSLRLYSAGGDPKVKTCTALSARAPTQMSPVSVMVKPCMTKGEQKGEGF